MRLAIVADDLTGAADASVAFARQGRPSRVLLDPSFAAGVDVAAVTTESRHLPPSVAAERVRGVAHHLFGTPLLYKKIDSTLRGNIAAELFALMETFDLERTLVAPAFPAQGRTTVYGRQLVNGRPLEESGFAGQIISSNLREIFLRTRHTRPVRLISLADVRHGSDRVTQLLADRSTGIVIADAETDADMTAIAEAALSSAFRLLCGSAGLCHALARLIPANHDRPLVPRPAASGPTLTIAGSRHAATIAQIDAARKAGITVIEPVNFAAKSFDSLIDHVTGLLEEGQDVILASHRIDASTSSELALPDRLARFTAGLLKRDRVGRMVLTGGDVASAVCRELGARAIDLFGEVEPGVPWGVLRGGTASDALVVTKAGGFGDEDAILTAIGFLKGA